jgi:hypothetical protein
MGPSDSDQTVSPANPDEPSGADVVRAPILKHGIASVSRWDEGRFDELFTGWEFEAGRERLEHEAVRQAGHPSHRGWLLGYGCFPPDEREKLRLEALEERERYRRERVSKDGSRPER